MTITRASDAPRITQQGVLFAGALVMLASGMAAVAGLNGDQTAMSLVASVAVAPIAISLAIGAARGEARHAQIAFAMLLIIESANFRYRDPTDKSLDWQVALKIAGLAGMLVLALPPIIKALREGIRVAPLLWLCLALLFVVSSSYAVLPLYSLVAALSMLAAFAFLQGIAWQYGRDGLVRVMAATALVLAVASIAAYFLLPSFARMSDWSQGAFVVTNRLQGVLGSANAAGAAGAFGLLLVLLLTNSWPVALRVFAGACFLFCMLSSDNRMSVGCTLLALAVYSVASGKAALKICAFGVLAAIGQILFDAYGDTILAGVARSGSSEEVLSATGRTQVWQVVLDMWGERPLLGYGYASAQSLLPTHPLLFKAAAHTHNFYLEVLFSTGIAGLVLLLAAVTASLRDALRNGDRAVVALLVFFLAYGITEPILSSLASFPAFALFTVVSMASVSSQGPSRSAAS